MAMLSSLCCCVNSQRKRSLIDRAIDPDYQGEVTLLLHSEAVRVMYMEPQYSFRCLLVFSFAIAKVFEKLSQLRKA